jgi:hypothetical protein
MGRSAARSLAAILFALQLGCATANLPTRISDTLYFGFDRPGGSLVTESEWSVFLSEVVTPRFPGGLTVWQASGQWKDSSGVIVREPSRVVQIIHDPGEGADRAIDEIVKEYERRFQQKSVMRVRERVQVAF